MRKHIAGLLTASLILSAPGPSCWAAVAASAGSASAGSSARGAAAGAQTSSALSLGSLAPSLAPLSLNAAILQPPASLALPQVSAQVHSAAVLPSAVSPVSSNRSAVDRAQPAHAVAGRKNLSRGMSAASPAAAASASAIPERAAAAKNIAGMAKSAAPHIDAASAKTTSAGSAHGSGLALEAILTGAKTRSSSADPVAAGRAFDALSRSGLNGASQSASFKDAGEPTAPKAAPQAPSAISRVISAVKRQVAAVVVASMIALSFGTAAGQDAPNPKAVPPAAAVQQGGQQAPAPAAVVQAPAPIEVRSRVIQADKITVGDSAQIEITIENTSKAPVTIASLRGALQAGLPMALELQGENGAQPITLAPGEKRTVVFDVLVFDSGEIKLDKAKIVFPGPNPRSREGRIEVPIPAAVIKVESVLTEDWQERGWRDLAEIQRGEKPSLLWLLAVPLGVLLLIGAERVLALRRIGREPKVNNGPILESTRSRLAALRATMATAKSTVFHREAFDILHALVVDLHGLPKRERDSAALAADIGDASLYEGGKVAYTEHQLESIRRMAQAMRVGAFSPGKDSEDRRRAVLNELDALLESLSPKQQSAGSVAGLAVLGVAGGLTFAHPWVFWLALPIAAFAVWRFLKKQNAPHAVSTLKPVGGKKSWRQRLRWLPNILRAGAVALVLLGAAKPEIGVERQMHTPPYKTVDTAIFIDGSGSMSSVIGTGDDRMPAVEAAKLASIAYVNESRRGSNNRIAVGLFKEDTYLAERLTTDYDVLVARINELEANGSTAVGQAILAGITHFIEANAYDLDSSDPRVAQIQKLVDEQKSMEALQLAKQHPDLIEKLLMPDRPKVVILFTDGDSNTGITPVDASKIAASLGIRVYTIGINTSGRDEAIMQEVARLSGGLYYNVRDPDAMRKALLDIDRLEKTPHPPVMKMVVKDYQSQLILLALMLLSAEVLLASTRLRTLQGLAFMMALSPLAGAPNFNPPAMMPVAERPAAMAPAQQPAADAPRQEALPLALRDMPLEMREGNAHYFRGEYPDAVKRYADGLAKNPEIAEFYFNLGNAYLRMGNFDAASRNYKEYLDRTQDPRKHSLVQYNLGNAAIMQRDLGRAIKLYRDALKLDRENQDAKWNLEIAMKMLKQQQQQQQQGQGEPQEGEGQEGEGQPQEGEGQPQQGEGKPGQGRPGQGRPGQGQPGQGQPGQGQPGPQERMGRPSPAEQGQGIDRLIEEQGRIQQGEGQRGQGAVPKQGSGVWGLAALPLLGSMAVGFGNPVLAWSLLVAVPIVAAFMIYSLRKKLQAARKLSPLTAPSSFRAWAGRNRWLMKFGAVNAAVAALAIAAGDPMFGEHDTRLNFGGQNVMVAVDGSASTLYAEDGRYDRMRKELTEFVQRMEGTDRIGLVVWAGKSRTASGLSVDYGNFEFKVRRLREREAQGLPGGSNLSDAIEHSITKPIKMAKKIGDRKDIIIVISDGDIFEQDLQKAIDLATAKGIAVYTIGIGTPAGARIVLPGTAEKGEPQYMIDTKTGQPVITRLNEAPLRALAERTGGAYFHADAETGGINAVMARISSLQNGSEVETIRQPRKVGDWLLWPALALLLLDLLTANKSLINRARREEKEAQAKARTGGNLNGFALFGLAALPLSIWPQILPFAAIVTVVAGLILFDMLTQRAVSRGLYARFTRGFARTGFERDLRALFDAEGAAIDRFRDADLESVDQFRRAWAAAKPGLKEALVEAALADSALWRQKLITAYLAESLRPSKSSGEILIGIESALLKGQRKHLSAVDPVLRGVLARRQTVDGKGELAWLSHGEVLRALSNLGRQFLDGKNEDSRKILESLSEEIDPRVRAAAAEALGDAQSARRPASLLNRIGMTATVLFLAAMLGLTGYSGVKSVEYSEQQAAAAQVQLEIFWGEDKFILKDFYQDARITQKVIPVLEKWNRGDAATQAELATALEILRDSPDPKSDNILEAIFKQSHILPLTEKSQTTLLRALVERDNESVWKFLQGYMQQNAENPQATKQLLKMIEIGAEVGSDRVFRNLFFFLTSPNPEVRNFAIIKLRASLNDPRRTDEFLNRLIDVSNFHAQQPILQLWVQFFAVDRLTQPGGAQIELAGTDALLERVRAITLAFDQQLRVAQITQQKIAPGQEKKLGTPLSAMRLGMLGNIADRAGAANSGKIPDVVAKGIEPQVHNTANDVIREGIERFPGLSDRLLKAGILVESDDSGRGEGGPEDYYHGHHGFGGYRGPSGPAVRDHYTLDQLKAIKTHLLAESGTDLKSMTVEQREYLTRAVQVIDQVIALATKIGIPESTAPGYAAAQEANIVLAQVLSQTGGPQPVLRDGLRAKGLVPDARVPFNETWRAFNQTYDRAALLALRDYMAESMTSAKTVDQNGAPRALTWGEKKNLAAAMAQLEALADKHFPAAAPVQAETLFAKINAVAAAMKAGDADKTAAAQQAVAEAYAAAPIKDLFLAQLHASREMHKDDAALNRWLLTFVSERYAKGDALDADGVKEIMDAAFNCCMKDGASKVEAWRAWTTAFETLRNNGKALPQSWVTAAKRNVDTQAKSLLEAHLKSLKAGSDEARAIDRALRDAYIYKLDGNLRADFRLYHLRVIQGAVSDASLKEQLGFMIKAAELAGVADGSSTAARAAEELNDILYQGYMKMPGQEFNIALRQKGLMPAGSGHTVNDYQQAYTAEEILAIYRFLDAYLTAGKHQTNAAFDDNNKAYFIEAKSRVKRLLEKHYPQAAAQITEKSLSELVDAWRNPATRAAAEPELAQALTAAAAKGTLSVELAIVQKNNAGDPAVQAWVLEQALSRLGSPNTSAANAAGAKNVIEAAIKALRENGAADHWQKLTQAIQAASDPAALKGIVVALIEAETRAIIEASEKEDSDLRGGFVSKGARQTHYSHQMKLRLDHLRGMREVMAASSSAKVKALLPQIDAMITAAEAAGMLPGNSQGERAAERVAPILQEGYQKFPGSDFSFLMAMQGLAAPTYSGHYNTPSWKDSYTKEEVAKARAYLQKLKADGQYKRQDGTVVPLTATLNDYLDANIAKLADLEMFYPDGGPAENVVEALHLGYQKFPAQDFVAMAVKAGITQGNTPNQYGYSSYDKKTTWNSSYDAASVEKIIAWYKQMLDAGKRVDGSDIALTETDRQALVDGLKMLESAKKKYEAAAQQPAAGGASMRGFALLGIAPLFAQTASTIKGSLIAAQVALGLDFALPGWAVMALSLLAGGVLLYWVFRKFKTPAAATGEGVQGQGQGASQAQGRSISPDVLARANRLAIKAKKNASSISFGQFKAVFKGPGGLDFAELAEFQDTDDIRDINWEASAEGDEVYVNRYDMLKNMPLMLVVDLSASSALGTRGTDKRTVIEDAAATLAFMAAHLNVRVGAVFYSDGVEEFIPAKGGQQHAFDLVTRLMKFQPKGRGSNHAKAVEFVQGQLRSRGMVAMLSDFIADGDIAGPLAQLSERHDVRPLRAIDSAELRPLEDAGLVLIADAETGEERWVDTSDADVRSAQRGSILRREEKLETAFATAQLAPVTLYTDADYLETLSQEFRGKK